ncbi:MAG: phosphoglycerate dehydrogenase [Acidobacteria bacterium]|nr:MAG: phosphoglycerate dehydrogenase [Acidobacteriota bacterium]
MKILVADNVSQKAVEVLQSDSSWNVVFLPKQKNLSLTEEIKDADALVVRSATKVDADLLAHAKCLRAIGRAGVGVDNVDLEAATRHGIVVMNTPGGSATSVAEQAVGFLVSLARRIPQADASMKRGAWEKKKLTGMELRGKTLGLIGLGRIGSEVARLARAFEMQVIAYDPYVPLRLAQEQGVRLVTLDELLANSDFISLHTAGTTETHHLINAETLAKMKPGVRIINCARGELIKENDLLEALETGHVAGAALDVFEKEPPSDSRLVAHPNVIATPHIAGSTDEALEIVGINIAEQIRDYLRLGVPRNAVNMPAISPEEYKKIEPYIQLGEKLGAFIAQIASERLEEVKISYDGGLAELNTHLVKNAVLKGILSKPLLHEINLVNAAALAQERGIEVIEVRSARRAAYSNSLGIALCTDVDSTSVLGMVGMRGLRVLGINDIDIEASLKGFLLFIRNQDVPGVIGRVGTILGANKVNIASFALGRSRQAGEAIGLVNIDELISQDVLDEIRKVPAVHFACVVEV